MTEKPSLVLVPGLLCTADLWREQISAFENQYSIMVADHTKDDRMPAIAARFLASAPPTFALAGLSMGGYIALEIVRQAPERVTHLAIMDSRPINDTPIERQRRQDFIKLVERGKTFKGVTETLLPMLIHPSRLTDDILTERIYKMAEDIGKEAFIRQEKALLEREELTGILKDIQCPTLVLAGAQDALIPPQIQREMAIEIPTAVYTEIPDCGHLPTMERPEKTTEIMRIWLAR
ncbi:alpha/beta hydrolase [Sneathiella marina]|uniref:Alpha/beta hydrolase n=1 Tax=Sneathiella marina TaxID=2950108 RepID=A0ABY4VXL5_9PROT|nr:alpha/beta hydrolase [Sneathiella marina]USG59660.1 alpha/beta hydrolase [Sneathiella marina]